MSRINDKGSVRVAAKTVDQVVRALGVARVDFIKADIEGAERLAIQGAAETISKFRPRMALCTYHLPDDPQVIPAAVQKITPYAWALAALYDTTL